MDTKSKAISFLLICHSYPPIIGGSELEAQRVCSALIRRGYKVTVVCRGGDPMPPLRNWIDPEGVSVRLYAGNWQGGVKDVVFAIHVCWMLIRERRTYDFVYFLMQGIHLAFGLPLARLLRKPILMKIAGSGVAELLTNSKVGRFELRALRAWAYRVMILNEGMRRESIVAGIPPTKLMWMPNPVDTSEFAPATPSQKSKLRRQFDIHDGALITLYCGRLAPEKALLHLIKAYAKVTQVIPEAFLILVGDGSERIELERCASEFKLKNDRVRFVGKVKPTEVNNWLKVADIFTLVSFNEGLPCALIEAMATALPSVVSDIPANQQLVEEGTHGFLTPTGDADKISQAIIRLLKAPELRREMGEASRQRVLESYSIDTVCKRYETLFSQMLTDHEF